ncbi:MAG: hypothetical protein ACRCTX_25830 [Afipia sp.]
MSVTLCQQLGACTDRAAGRAREHRKANGANSTTAAQAELTQEAASLQRILGHHGASDRVVLAQLEAA